MDILEKMMAENNLDKAKLCAGVGLTPEMKHLFMKGLQAEAEELKADMLEELMSGVLPEGMGVKVMSSDAVDGKSLAEMAKSAMQEFFGDMDVKSREELVEGNEELAEYEDEESPAKVTRIYMASGFFSDTQNNLLNRVAKQLHDNPTVATVFEPANHQGTEPYGTERWGNLTFESDVQAMDNADVIVAALTQEDLDSGTVWETAYMYANNKPVIIVYEGTSLNLMPARGAGLYVEASGDTNLTSEKYVVEDLATMDFNALPTNVWLGELI